MKQGENFENLVSWISKCLHTNAVITPNNKLIDKHTGNKRQIDISIKLKDGPTEFIAIVEARERSRPVGVSYIEEINQKKESVNANSAIIVSNKGFYKSALKKAEVYGIKTITLKQALKEDWSQTHQIFKGTIYKKIQFENATIYFLEIPTNRIINMHSTFKEKLEGKNKNELIFTDINGNPFKSILDVVHLATSNKDLWNYLEKLNGQKEHMKLIVTVPPKNKAFFLDQNEQRQSLERVGIIGDFWIETKIIPPNILQYGSANDNKIYAEIITIDDEIDILVENPDDISKDRNFFVRQKGKD